MTTSTILYLNFKTGEVRELTEEEHRKMVYEQLKRTKVKNGIVYIDCDPPSDDAA